MGWHLGHIAFIESAWILEKLAGEECPWPQYRRFFAADGLPKAERENLPALAVIVEYLATVRQRVEHYLATAPLEQQNRLWWWLLQHESQHAETMTIVLALHRLAQEPEPPAVPTGAPIHPPAAVPLAAAQAAGESTAPMIYLPATEGHLGYDGLEAMDNEFPRCPVQVEAVWIDRYPVTQGAYRQFMAAGGYENSEWWSVEGWAWLVRHPVQAPLYWRDGAAWDAHPVCGVNWHEASAYARFVGKRLPTEAEWERAAWDLGQSTPSRLYPWGVDWPQECHCNHHSLLGHTSPVGAYPPGQSAAGCDDLLGNVWEWTDSWFAGYPGFTPFPYPGYSQAYFDGEHRVLRGGSWATFPWALRGTLRNWYHPHMRQMFAGFRCARSVLDSEHRI